MSTEVNSVNTKQEIEVDAEKRAFMKKFGKYAAVGAGMATLMSPTSSTAGNYQYKRRGPQGNNGLGNFDQPAPGKSRYRNNAENRNGRVHKKFESIPD